MCVIAVSECGIPQPTMDELRKMWGANPDGAGFMYAKNGTVRIEKGFMAWKDFEKALRRKSFSAADSVVYHFRISTQAGICPSMTHPFPVCEDLSQMEKTHVSCKVGIAHNGIIKLTSDRNEKDYSDTALFVSLYLSRLIRKPDDIYDSNILDMIYLLGESKFALMNGCGDITTVGRFYTQKNGILLSNENHVHPYGVSSDWSISYYNRFMR